VLGNQGLLAIAFFEAPAFVVLLVLFFLLRRDHPASFFRSWLTGWTCLTISSLFELGLVLRETPELRMAALGAQASALVVFLLAVTQYTVGLHKRKWPVFPLTAVVVAGIWWLEAGAKTENGSVHWATSTLESIICLWAGWLLWRAAASHKGYGGKLLAGGFFVYGLNGMDRPLWPQHPVFLLRVAFDHFLLVAVGVAMVVLVLERARARSEELNDKMRRLTLLIAASTQTLSVDEVLEQVLGHLVGSLGATHGLVRLAEGPATAVQLTARASVGFSQAFLEKHGQVSASEPWVQRVMNQQCVFLRFEEEQDPRARERMTQSGMSEIVALALPGKDGPLGIIVLGSTQNLKFQADEISYLGNVANLLGLTLQNVRLFEQVATVQQQWAYTFDSIGDPILVHDREFRILRSNQRLSHLLGRETSALVGRAVADLLTRKTMNFGNCPYCEGVAGEGDETDPWLPGYFLASNSTFTDPQGRQLGTVHVLKDITDRKRAEEKYRTLVSNVQEGVFISTPAGRFLDFNDALMRMLGYEHREELLGADIPMMYVNSSDRERLKKILQEHGTVADFEFEIRRRDGEVRTMMESSIAVRDAGGNVTAFQGFLLDITDRKRAEQEIRRRNRELMVLNSIAQTLTESMDLNDSLYRTLRQLSELFSLDASSLYLFDEPGLTLRRIAAVGYRSDYARSFPKVSVQPELVQHIKAVRAKFLSAQGLPLPSIFRTVQQSEGIESSFLVILWSKDRVGGVLAVGSRAPRDFSPADINLLIAVGSQIANAIDRTVLYEETRQAYDNLRRTQEQLLHSEKMAAVGQLISGVAHELNNPLTAILGYSQLLTSSADVGPQGIEYTDKLYKQAQRTHRIVQNLLSFARQHKPERVAVHINQILEETLALRDYDLRMKNIRVHFELAPDLPVTAADPHQLQQVFLNMVNNAVDAVMDSSNDGDIWVRTGVRGDRLVVEFTDNGPGVREPSRVFDPFYTTKPVGKGTGLGLSICYGIITEHGGTIRVRNVSPHGASFAIELPFQPAEKMQPVGSGHLPSSTRAGRVVLLDRDPSVLEEVSAILRERNHTVRTATALSEAQSVLLEEEFDLILADSQLCGAADQIGLRGWLLANRPELATRVILMRATTPSMPSSMEMYGVLQVLQKPFKAGELLAAIEAALSNVHTVPVER
jgi:two-component system NtrC family sensor kinase